MSKSNAQRGYSLAEALVVIAIIGIVTAVSVPSFLSIYHGNQLKVSMRQMTNDMRWARQLAVMSQRRTRMEFTTGTAANTYSIFQANTNGTWPVAPIRTGTMQNQTYIDATTFTDFDGNTKPDIVFNIMGGVDVISGVSTVTLKSQFNKGSVTQYVISVSPTGSVAAH
jgi:prepilin-type N-terminal cleavage/methylation domain-containing protein